MTPQEWIKDVRESIERDDEPRPLLEYLKVGADHLAAALEEIAERGAANKVGAEIEALLRLEITRLRAEAGRVVVPELTPDGMSTAAFVEGYRFATSRAHSVPSSRVLNDGEVAVDARELAALRDLFSAAGNTIANIRSGVTIAEINDAWAGVCSAQIMRTQATATESGEKGGA